MKIHALTKVTLDRNDHSLAENHRFLVDFGQGVQGSVPAYDPAQASTPA
jgi:hypothetical protein